VSLVLDSGALLAVERNDRETVALIKREFLANRVPLTHGGVIGQVWRGGAGRQVNLGRLLPALDVRPLDAALGRRAGMLLRATRTADVIDAALALLATEGDSLLTSDPDDLAVLVAAAGTHADVVRI
jgi:hypothetical protein